MARIGVWLRSLVQRWSRPTIRPLQEWRAEELWRTRVALMREWRRTPIDMRRSPAARELLSDLALLEQHIDLEKLAKNSVGGVEGTGITGADVKAVIAYYEVLEERDQLPAYLKTRWDPVVPKND